MSESTRAKKSAAQKGFITFLLALPYVFLCFPKMYNRATPALLGFPFFYWYQLAWVIVTSALLWIVYLQLRSE
jgi:hypothetical protein